MTECRVDVIIPVHNAPQHFVPCIRSVVRWTPEGICNLYVADDASDDESRTLLEELSASHPRIEIFRSEENLGFLRTCNAAIQRTGGEFVLLLNSDTVVTPGWLEKMIRCADSDPRIALVNPLANSATVFAIDLAPGTNFRSIAEALSGIEPRYPDVCPSTGFCLMIRRAALEEAGSPEQPMDEAYGNGWFEDLDLYMRLVTSGWRGVACDNAYIYHRGEGSFDRTEGVAEYERNRELFESRWGDEYFPRLERARTSGATRHVTRLFRDGARDVIAAISRHLPLVFGGHPRRFLYRMGRDLATPASILNPTRKFLRRFTIAGTPSLIFVLGSALEKKAYERLRGLANALILRDVDCRVLTTARQDDRSPRDSYFGAALYTSVRKLARRLPPADFVCVLPAGAAVRRAHDGPVLSVSKGGAAPGVLQDGLGELAEEVCSSPEPLSGGELGRLLSEGDLGRVLRGDDETLSRRLREVLVHGEAVSLSGGAGVRTARR